MEVERGRHSRFMRVERRVYNREIVRALNKARRGALAPGLFIREFEDRIIHANAEVNNAKRPAVRIRRIKKPRADAPRLASTVFFVCYMVQLVSQGSARRRACLGLVYYALSGQKTFFNQTFEDNDQMASSSKRTIVVTGATRGCGRAMTERFIEAGHTVIGCGRSATWVNEITSRFGAPHRFDAVDVSDDRQVGAWAKSVIESGLVPDLLVNNAAIINRNAPLWEVTAQDFQQIVNVNIVGVANVIRHFVPAMIERSRGTIVNFSSGWGRSTSPEVAPYCATKYAIEGLSQALAQELPSGMVAVALNPGIINTEMLQSCWADGAAQYPTPERWSRVAAPYILSIGAKENGRPLTVPL